MKKLRIWKLGSLEYNIVPSKESVELFRSFIENNEVTDIIWSPDVELLEVDLEDDDINLVVDGVKFSKGEENA